MSTVLAPVDPGLLPRAPSSSAVRVQHRLCVAPMMDWTDRHCRYLHRLIAPGALLYTEMVTAGAILHGDVERLLAFDASEQPVALQLGGSEPEDLARAVEMARPFGYDEINLNVGCPSDRVRRGSFGACLMAEPELVADCCRAMIEAGAPRMTVKTRIGIDDSADSMLDRFVDTVAEAGVRVFIVHARKAWLKGLSPKQNREIPPLRHDVVHALKRRRPDLTVVINGGIGKAQEVLAHLAHVDGVMIGREAYQNPMSLVALAEACGIGHASTGDVFEIIARMADYADAQAERGVPLRAIARHMLGLLNGRRGARAFRRALSEGMHDPSAEAALLRHASSEVARESHDLDMSTKA